MELPQGLTEQPQGLTEQEKACGQLLAEAWNAFIALDARTTDDDTEFRHAIHAAQSLLALRVARRVDPHLWNQPNG